MSDSLPPMTDEALGDIESRLSAVEQFNPLPWTSEYDSFGVEINFGPTFKIEDATGDLVFATDSVQELADLLRFAPTDLRRLLDEVKRLRGRNRDLFRRLGEHMDDLGDARSECAALAAKVEAVRKIKPQRRNSAMVTSEQLAMMRGWNDAVDAIRAAVNPCECGMTDPSTWTTYGGLTEPGSAYEWNPDCPAHGDAPEPAPEMPRPPAEEGAMAPDEETEDAIRGQHQTTVRGGNWVSLRCDCREWELEVPAGLDAMPRLKAAHAEHVAEMVAEGARLAAQKPISGPETAGTGSGRGTGVAETQASDG